MSSRGRERVLRGGEEHPRTGTVMDGSGWPPYREILCRPAMNFQTACRGFPCRGCVVITIVTKSRREDFLKNSVETVGHRGVMTKFAFGTLRR